MKDTKYRYEMLCIYDYRGVEAHLTTMAAKGWRLEKAGAQLWKYRRAEPAEVRYAVTYNAGASQFNPGPTEGQQSLEELCEAAGWAKVCDWFQMQIFCSEDLNAVPLETDEALRMETIHRSMRKNYLPSNIVLLVIGLLMSISFLQTLFVHPYHIFERNYSLFSGSLFLIVLALEIYTLFHYYGWRRKSRKSIEAGGPCVPISTKTYQRLNRWGLALVGILVVLYVLMEAFTNGRGMVLFFVVYTALLLLLAFLVRRTTAVLRSHGVSKGKNIAGTLIVDVVLAFALIGGLTYGIIHNGWFFVLGEKETYEYQGWAWDVSPEEGFPLTFTDLTGQEYEHISRLHYGQGSFFIPESSYYESVLHEDTPGHAQTCSISYTVWDFRLPWLRDSLVQSYLEGVRPVEPSYGAVYQYLPEDPAPWGLEEVYRRYIDGEPLDTWLLVWPGRAAVFSFTKFPEESLTEAQKAVIAARLAPNA